MTSQEETREFSLGAVLTVITGKVLAEPGQIHELLDFMTGDALMSHQLGRALTECQPEMCRQHPDLADSSVPEFDGERHAQLWIQVQEATLGAYREVRPLPPGIHVQRDPIAELIEMMTGGAS